MRISRIVTIIGLYIIIAAFTIWALHIVYPDLFPAWVDALFYILGGLGALFSVAGSVFSDLLLPIIERSKPEPDLRLEHLLKPHAPIRQTSYEELLARLGNSGRIPWLDRHIASTNVLLEGNRIAIIGPMKSGKTREAVELIDHAKKNGLITLVFEPTASLDLIPIDRLREAVGMHAERNSSLFFIDELGLWQSDDDLERIAICIDTITEVRPSAYILVTLQYERLTSKLDDWLQTNRFQRFLIPTLTGEQRIALVQLARRALNVNLDDNAVELLAHATQVTKPWDIVSVLQSAPLHDSGAPALDQEQIQAILSQSQDALWKGQRQEIITAQPAAAQLLDAIATFISAGVTPRSNSVRRYAEHNLPDRLPRVEKKRSLQNAIERLQRFDIVSVSGNFSIPEPRLLPLIFDKIDARNRLNSFSNEYKPHLVLRFFYLLLYPVEIFGKSSWLSYLRRKPFSILRSIGKRVLFILLPILNWQADNALLKQELGLPSSRPTYLSSAAFWAKGRELFAQGNYSAALIEFNRALKLNPDHTPILERRGLLFIVIGDLKKAQHDIKRVIELDPTLVKAVTYLGIIYDKSGMIDKSLAQYGQAIQLDPSYNWLYINRGSLLRRLLMYEESLSDLNKAINLSSKKSQAFFERALLHRDINHYGNAIADLTEAIHLSPESSKFLTHRSCIYLQKGEIEAAYADVHLAIQSDPQNDWSHGVLALIEKKRENHDNWRTHIIKAIELAKQHITPTSQLVSQFNLAFFYLVAGDNKEAKLLYEETLKEIVCCPELADALSNLQLYRTVQPNEPLSQTIIDLITAIITNTVQSIDNFGKDISHAR